MPRELEATLWTKLPEKLHYTGEPTEWSKTVRPGKRLHSFLEGPAFDRDGNLYCSDTPHGRIFRIDPTGHWDVALDYDGQPNGLAFHRDGRLFIADYRRGLLAAKLGRADVTPIVEEAFLGLSDLVFTSTGDLYLTDAGHSSLRDPSGRVYRLTADGALERLVSNVPFPNGVALDPSENEVYVAATRANAVWKLGRDAGMVGVFLHLSGGLGPDGLAVDTEGRLAIAHARNGIVWLFDETGEPRYEIHTGGKSVTNVAYGAASPKTLYITEADHGAIWTVELDVPGRPLFSHR